MPVPNRGESPCGGVREGGMTGEKVAVEAFFNIKSLY